MKSKYWILLFGVLIAVCCALSLWLLWPGVTADFAEIWSDGVMVKRVSLRTDQTFTVEGEHGINVVTVSGGKIGVTEADCPDHYCMHRGMCNSGAQIVCLPNRLVIKFVNNDAVDGVVG